MHGAMVTSRARMVGRRGTAQWERGAAQLADRPLPRRVYLRSSHGTLATSPRRLVVSHEAPLTSGFGAEIVAAIADRCFYSLEAPPLRITGYDTPFPLVCEPLYLPGVQRVVDGVRQLLQA